MKSIFYKRWEFLVDVEATRKAYDTVLKGGAEDCNCLPCQNFAAAKHLAFPREVLALFKNLGVDPTKEAEVCHYGKSNSGNHCYGGWTHFIGYVTSGKKISLTQECDMALRGESYNNPTMVRGFDMEKVDDSCQIGFAEGGGLYHNSFNHQPLVQIEFVVEVPWILQDFEEEL